MRIRGMVAALLLLGCGSSGSSGGIGGAGGSGGLGGGGGGGGSGAQHAVLTDAACGALAFGQLPGVTVHCSLLEVPADWRSPDGPERFSLPVTRFVPQA